MCVVVVNYLKWKMQPLLSNMKCMNHIFRIFYQHNSDEIDSGEQKGSEWNNETAANGCQAHFW